LLLILGWVVLPDPWFWITFVTALAILPPLLFSAWGALRKPQEISLWQHFRYSFRNTSKTILQVLFGLVTLPYEAMVSADAIVRTLFRLIISRRKLLEWNPSGFLPSRKENLADPYRTMRVAPLVGFLVLSWLVYYSSYVDLLIVLPYLLAWIASPAIVWWMSLPLPYFKQTLSNDQQNRLRELARKTWAFFEETVAPGDNWLPPDNLQLFPEPILAHRTSPTNIGLALLANLSAWDFGYLTTDQLLSRTGHTLDAMDKLQRYAGHFFNWYDTQTLQPLAPRYVSTVDSGNLAGYLLTLRQGLLDLPGQKCIDPKTIAGLLDTLRLLQHQLPDDPSLRDLAMAFEKLEQDVLFPWSGFRLELEKLFSQYQQMPAVSALPAGSEAHRWAKSLEEQFQAILAEITHVAPWFASSIPEKFNTLPGIQENLTLAELADLDQSLEQEAGVFFGTEHSPEEKTWLDTFRKSVHQASQLARARIARITGLAVRCEEFANMEYDFLYDNSQHLLSIGYNVEEHRRDGNYYDLLASEARLGVFIAIAQGKIPQESWFALGRRLTSAGNTPVLLSWSGSMFEYLMPWLV
ncbi:MAG: cyclic beta 1-2 glucan synthetase, partial [Saprospiraceae bacterium]